MSYSKIGFSKGQTLTAANMNHVESGIANAHNAVSSHATDGTAHNDIRLAIEGLATRLNALADSDDTTLDQLSEIVAYIKSNKTLIDAITTSKVSIVDIVDNLTTNASNKPLSAAQGVALKALINEKIGESQLSESINNALAQAKASGEFDGEDYILTDADKSDIAEMIDGATIVQAPKYVDNYNDMIDTERVYVLAETGKIWAYMDTTSVQEITEKIEGTTENPFYDNYRLGSDGSHQSLDGYVVTPYIDLSKYSGTIKLTLGGIQYIHSGQQSNVRVAFYDESKSKIACGASCLDASAGYGNTLNAVFDDDGITAICTINIPYTVSGLNVTYLRFSTVGTSEASKISITHTATVSGGHWVNTNTTYAPTLTDNDKQAIVDEIANMIDSELLSIVGDGTVTM